MKNSVLCLFSGGIDSTVMVKHYLDKGWDVKSLFLDYGQKCYETELNSVSGIAMKLEFEYTLYRVSSFYMDDKFFYPMRNAFLLSFGINIAYGLDIPRIAMACNQGEFLDQRPEFIDRFNFMQEYCLKKPIWVLAPFSNWSSERVIKYGLKIGAPLNLTTSCMEIPACGKCLKCKLRKKYGIDKVLPAPNPFSYGRAEVAEKLSGKA